MGPQGKAVLEPRRGLPGRQLQEGVVQSGLWLAERPQAVGEVLSDASGGFGIGRRRNAASGLCYHLIIQVQPNLKTLRFLKGSSNLCE